MIDIHTHILPHFDDGAKDVETSVAMLKAEQAQGVKTVVLTSHYYGRRYSPEQFLARRREAYANLAEHIPQGLEVRLGAEVHFTGINVPEHEELAKLAVEGTKCLLIEFPFTSDWTRTLFDKLADFTYDTGCTPIIAHVERYVEILKSPALLNELLQMGCLLQVNTSSFFEKSTKNFVRALLKRGYVHAIGTDAHDMAGRAPEYSTAQKEVERMGCGDVWKNAQKLMTKVLGGEQVCVECGKPIKKIFGKYV